jgi:isoquinoline 1-oxidoreductase
MPSIHDAEEWEVERYELREPMLALVEPDRRGFAKTVGGGLLVVAALAPSRPAQAQPGRAPRRDETLAERFHLGEDGFITVFTSKVEVGQGSRTQITQAVAEELRIPVDRIRVVMADTQRCPDDGGTAGSRTTPSTVPRVRAAAAAIARVLTTHAAERLGTTADRLEVGAGEFRSGPHSLTLAQLSSDASLRSRLATPGQLAGMELTAVDRWKVLGTSVSKVTGKDVVTGRAQYPSDMILPDMLYAKVLRPVSYGAKLVELDTTVAQAMPGVRVVREGDWVACAASTSFAARQATQGLSETARWEQLAHQPSSDTLNEHFKKTTRLGDRRNQSRWGDFQKAIQQSIHKLQARYSIPYIQHAPMEPRAAVAQWEGDQLTVWTGSQQPSRVQSELVQAFRLAPTKVRVIVPDTGGGFGGKHTGEAAVEAARIAKAVQHPVHLRWTREEEFTWAYFRPAGVIEIQAGLDASNNLLAWEFINYNSGASAIRSPYKSPHGMTEYVSCDSPLRQGSYRALASTFNTFAREAAIDELASLAKEDPLAFRLRHLEEDRLRGVLRAAAQRFRWEERPPALAPNRGIGLACGTEKGSFVACCAEIEIQDREIRVRRVCQAFECGAIQNPHNLEAQVAGSVVMGLGGALTEAIVFREGQVVTNAFSSYRVPRLSDLPELDIVLVNRPDLSSVGGSETPIIAIAPAIANAVHAATGQRLRSLPLKLPG